MSISWDHKYSFEYSVLLNGVQLRLTPFLEPIWNGEGELVALELLTRIHDVNANKSVSPFLFFSLVCNEEQLLIFQWQLELLLQMLPWCHLRKIPVSVNINRYLAEKITDIYWLNKVDALAPWLRLEINELAVIPGLNGKDDPVIHRLKDVVPLWLDDFGMGTTTIPLLVSGDFERIKISHQLIHLLSMQKQGAVFLNAMQKLCSENKKPLIAEGV
ncbi:EAL domain-containing protein, partial [Buttiauxella gaviniae]|uniref:EAL domain-containing protein n=1 Tax=Buttiauxella gaviniae TaxID=82990 RepID=UPI0007E3A9C6